MTTHATSIFSWHSPSLLSQDSQDSLVVSFRQDIPTMGVREN